jgi:hypothetical protein
MKIVLATPLYQPDVEPVAVYCKEFARRLAEAGHTVIVATYGNLPEKVPGVTVITTDKRQLIFTRITNYTVTLWKVARDADVIYAQNGASVELPLILIAPIIKKPIIFLSIDTNATKQAEKNFFFNILARAIRHRAHLTINRIPPQKPEILPFEARPEKVLVEYEAAWKEHIRQLTHTIP